MARLAALCLGVLGAIACDGRPLQPVDDTPDAGGRGGASAGGGTAGSSAGTTGTAGSSAGTTGSGGSSAGTTGTGGTAGSVGPSDPPFLPAVEYATGFNTSAVAIGDLDGDGRADIAVASYGMNDAATGAVSVLRNLGDGRFAAAVNYPVFGMPEAIALGDVTGDGKPDLVVQDANRSAISLLRNDGRGGFSGPGNYGTDRYPKDVAIADLNGDGRNDIATANSTGTVSVLISAKPDFASHVDYPVGKGTGSIVAADLNGDGRPDLAVGNWGIPGEDGNVAALWNRGDGTFDAAVTYLIGEHRLATGLTAGDLDGDGRVDLAVVDYTSQYVLVLSNLGNRSFAPNTQFFAGTEPIAVAIGDIDGMWGPDLVCANYVMSGNGTANLLMNGGTARFANPRQYGAGASPMDVAVGELNGDGRLDIVIANEVGASVSVLLSAPR